MHCLLQYCSWMFWSQCIDNFKRTTHETSVNFTCKMYVELILCIAHNLSMNSLHEVSNWILSQETRPNLILWALGWSLQLNILMHWELTLVHNVIYVVPLQFHEKGLIDRKTLQQWIIVAMLPSCWFFNAGHLAAGQ